MKGRSNDNVDLLAERALRGVKAPVSEKDSATFRTCANCYYNSKTYSLGDGLYITCTNPSVIGVTGRPQRFKSDINKPCWRKRA